MKNISLVVNAVLVVAVAVLFYLHFKSPSNVATKSANINGSMKIAYVNTDSLLEHYDFYTKSKKELEAEEEKNTNMLNGQAQALQREFEDAQAKVSTMTAMQAQFAQENLQKKQQNLMQQKEMLSDEFGKKMQKMTDDLTNKIHDYLKQYNKDKHYDYILGFQRGGGILYAQTELDITKEIVKGMNEEYSKLK
jgi:outer membrane protein